MWRGELIIESIFSLELADFRLTWCAGTEVGKVRELNEDNYLAVDGLYVVADGMGGHLAGDVASDLVIAVCREASTDVPMRPEQIESLISEANKSVLIVAEQSGLHGMGTTMVGIALVEVEGREALGLFNIGDSRCYRLQNGVFEQLTTDHSFVQEMIDTGQITRRAAERHPERNVITRAIGLVDQAQPDIELLEISGGSRYLLCSDGITGEITDIEIERLIDETLSTQEAVEGLLSAVTDGKARDNATAIVIDIEYAGPRDDLPILEDDDTEKRQPLPPEEPKGLIEPRPHFLKRWFQRSEENE